MDQTNAGQLSRLARSLMAGGLLLGLFLAAMPGASASVAGNAQQNAGSMYVLTGINELLRVSANNSSNVRDQVGITGLATGENLLGIDFRPLTGRLYGIGSTSQLYAIDTKTGFASKLGASFAIPLDGTEFGFDFNPAVDRIRIVSNTGQNLRVNPDTGMLVDTDPVAPGVQLDGQLQYAAGDANAGKAPNVVAAAYTNPDTDPATPTELYNIDAALDIVTEQDPPNAGTLNTTGSLGIDVSAVTGFDIGAQGGRTGFAALQPSGMTASRLYSINLDTGYAGDLGVIGDGQAIRGLAVVLDSPRFQQAYALTTSNQLIGFDFNRSTMVNSRVDITGLAMGENLLGIDFRPSVGRLYGVSSASQLYVIDHSTGVASKLGASFAIPLDGTEFGFDFNPAVDRIRIVSNTGQNLRVNPDTGMLVDTDPVAPGVQLDGQLQYAAGDANAGKAPNVVAAAYTNPDTDPATPTELYNIDAALDIVTEQDPPNAGTLNTTGSLGIDVSAVTGFDIGAQGGRTGFAALQPSGMTASRLYSINLDTGYAGDLGVIGDGQAIRGLAIAILSDTGRQDYKVFIPLVAR